MSGVSRPFVVANCKMNGLTAALGDVPAISTGVNERAASESDLVVCPPTTLIAAAGKICAASRVARGGQSCRARSYGAHTGDISAEVLRDAGASCVIVGQNGLLVVGASLEFMTIASVYDERVVAR